MKLALCTDRSENIEHISQLIVGNDFKYEIQLVICKKDSSASLYCIKNGIENFDYDKENDNKTIDMRTTQKIENGDINFFVEKNYDKDLKYYDTDNTIKEKIDLLRNPVRLMNQTEKEKVLKYVQNLKKIADLYN